MDAENVSRLLFALDCGRVTPSSSWINATCPLARWKHAKGKDERPSFGVSVVPGGLSHFQCFTCNSSGDLRSLLWWLRALRGNGKWFERASKLVMKESISAEEVESMLAFAENGKESGGGLRGKLKRATYAYRSTSEDASSPSRDPGFSNPEGAKVLSLAGLKYDILPKEDLDSLREIPSFVYDYLTGTKRRLRPATLSLWELGWQKHARRIVIPTRDLEGRLVGISGRCLDVLDVNGKWIAEQEPKFLHSKGFKRNYFLFGEHLAEKGSHGILVEGCFDVMYLRQMGYPNAVGTQGTHLSPVQVEKLISLFRHVTIFPDGDKAGIEAAQHWAYMLKGRVPVEILDVAEDGRDPDNYKPEELQGLLDNLLLA